MELRIDPEFEGKIPPLTTEEFQQLENNILANIAKITISKIRESPTTIDNPLCLFINDFISTSIIN